VEHRWCFLQCQCCETHTRGCPQQQCCECRGRGVPWCWASRFASSCNLQAGFGLSLSSCDHLLLLTYLDPNGGVRLIFGEYIDYLYKRHNKIDTNTDHLRSLVWVKFCWLLPSIKLLLLHLDYWTLNWFRLTSFLLCNTLVECWATP